MRHSQSTSCAAELPSAQEHRPAHERSTRSSVRCRRPARLARPLRCLPARTLELPFVPPASTARTRRVCCGLQLRTGAAVADAAPGAAAAALQRSERLGGFRQLRFERSARRGARAGMRACASVSVQACVPRMCGHVRTHALVWCGAALCVVSYVCLRARLSIDR
jgi:hypothetical protein